MAKCKVILAHRDLRYLEPLESLLMREFGEQLELSLITDPDYLQKLFAAPQQTDLLLVQAEMETPAMRRLTGAEIFVLSDDPAGGQRDGRQFLYEYQSPQEIAAVLRQSLRRRLRAPDGRCRLIAVFSPAGGSGKTTVALGLCAALAAVGSRVLFLDTQSIQTAGAFFRDPGFLSDEAVRALRAGTFPQELLRRSVRTERFDYLPPLRYAAANCGLNPACFFTALRQIRGFSDYDFLVADTAGDCTEETARLLQEADVVLIPTRQDAVSAAKIEALRRNLDTSDESKYLFLCNAYRAGEPDAGGEAQTREYLPLLPAEETGSVEQLAGSAAFRGLAYRILS